MKILILMALLLSCIVAQDITDFDHKQYKHQMDSGETELQLGDFDIKWDDVKKSGLIHEIWTGVLNDRTVENYATSSVRFVVSPTDLYGRIQEDDDVYIVTLVGDSYKITKMKEMPQCAMGVKDVK